MTELDNYIDLGELFNEQFDRPADCRCDEQLNKGAICAYCLGAGFLTPNTEVN